MDYFDGLVARAKLSAEKASRKFPQPNYVTLKVAEEAGEVVRGCVHFAENRMLWDDVEGEIVQLLAMLIRLVNEGDEINGVRPPCARSSEREANAILTAEIDQQSSAREKLAQWMMQHSFATGHGDTMDDLLGELSCHVKELRAKS